MINITQIYKVNMYLLLDRGRFTVCMEYRTCILIWGLMDREMDLCRRNARVHAVHIRYTWGDMK